MFGVGAEDGAEGFGDFFFGGVGVDGVDECGHEVGVGVGGVFGQSVEGVMDGFGVAFALMVSSRARCSVSVWWSMRSRLGVSSWVPSV